MTAVAQLALLVDPLENDLEPAAIAAVEARVEHDDQAHARSARAARPCRCERPWPFDTGYCLKCGRTARQEETR